MQKDATYAPVRFPAYITQRQLALLREVASERGESVTELLREAVHYWLKRRGKWDGLIYDKEEFYREYLRGREEMREAALHREEEFRDAKEAK
jgi:hypothetical protein